MQTSFVYEILFRLNTNAVIQQFLLHIDRVLLQKSSQAKPKTKRWPTGIKSVQFINSAAGQGAQRKHCMLSHRRLTKQSQQPKKALEVHLPPSSGIQTDTETYSTVQTS